MQIIGVVLFVVFTLVTMMAPSWGSTFVAHEAYYTLEIVKKLEDHEKVTDVRGMVLVNQEKSCDGWSTMERLKMAVSFGDGRATVQNIQFSGWESIDGKLYRFAVKGNTPAEEFKLRGSANLTIDGGVVNFVVPKKSVAKLPGKTKFPMGFISTILEKAKAGEKKIGLYSFDGRDGGGPEWFQILVLGNSISNASSNLKNEPLLSGKGWRFNVTAFPMRNKLLDPLYSYEAEFLENGIMVGAILNFEGFKVRQSLKMFKALSPPRC